MSAGAREKIAVAGKRFDTMVRELLSGAELWGPR